jgi:hypothetical protein
MSVVPLDQEDSHQREIDDQRPRSQPAGFDDEMRYVLKEGQRIGEGYYLVEMATDGRGLTISAFDSDAKRTLELLVNEKNHRKLFRETNGDYSALSARLRVEGDRLILADAGYDAAEQELGADEVVRASAHTGVPAQTGVPGEVWAVE